MSRKMMHLDRLRRLVSMALGEGAERVSAVRTVWRIAGDCRTPYTRELVSRPSEQETWREALTRSQAPSAEPWDGLDLMGKPRVRKHPKKWVTSGKDKEHTLILELETRCRKCDPCRKARGRLWRYRALHELGCWGRTWFGTLTLSPENQYKYLTAARMRLSEQGVDYDALGYGEQFLLRHREISVELTKYIKRLRKQSGPLRYLIVCEQHKSGLPHYHALVHECDSALPVLKATLDEQWLEGFSQWRLVKDHARATYLCKYLSKTAVARVRASIGYGDATSVVGANGDVKNIDPTKQPRL